MDPNPPDLDRELRQLWGTPPAPPPELRAAILKSIADAPRKLGRPRWASRRALAAAAAALVVIGVVGVRVAMIHSSRGAQSDIELTVDDEQFALASNDDDDSDDSATVLDTAADE